MDKKKSLAQSIKNEQKGKGSVEGEEIKVAVATYSSADAKLHNE